MKSVRAQLLVTLVAVAAAGGLFARNGPPPGRDLFSAVEWGDATEVERYLRWNAVLLLHYQEEWPFLHVAACYGHKDVVRVFLRYGFDVNAHDRAWSLTTHEGATPLLCAVDRGHADVVELLVANGAEVNVGTDDGWTPLDEAMTRVKHDPRYEKEIVAILRRHGAQESEP